MAATIKDVAKLAQVSVATVSRAMNGSAKVSSLKQKKIKNAIKKLDYKPNIIAKSMISHQLRNIGLVLSHTPDRILQSPYVSRMFVGFAQAYSGLGVEALLVLAENEKQEIEKCCNLYAEGTVQGFILMGVRVYDRTIRELMSRKIPFVVLGHPHPDSVNDPNIINSVDTDNYNDTKEATEYLLKMGHRRICLMHSSLGYMVNQERYNGYALALQDAGIELDDSLIFDVGYTIEDALEVSRKIIELDPLPTAVITTDDMKAVAFMKMAIEKGLRIPDDISVVGHNNYSESKICTPSLTTVNVPIEDLGFVAGKLLYEVLNNPVHRAQRILIPSHMVYRDSVKCLKKEAMLLK